MRDELEAGRLSDLLALRKWFYRLIPATTLLSVFLLTVIFLEPENGHPLAPLATLLYATPGILLLFLIVILPGLCWGFLYLIAVSYGTDVRMKVLPVLAGYFGSDWRYRKSGTVDQNTLLASGLIPRNSRVAQGDLLTGTHQGAPVQMGELQIFKTVSKADTGKRRETLAFRGVAITVRVRRKFHHKTIGLRDKGHLNWTRKEVGFMKQVTVDHSEFESEFEVYSSDAEEARFLLHDKLTPLLLDLVRSFRDSSGKKCVVSFSFNNKTLVILIDSNVEFFQSPSVFQPALQTPEFKQYLHKIGVVRRIVEKTDVDRFRR